MTTMKMRNDQSLNSPYPALDGLSVMHQLRGSADDKEDVVACDRLPDDGPC